MEYFLYAVTEAHRCVAELKQMEKRINELQDELELAAIELAHMSSLATNYFR